MKRIYHRYELWEDYRNGFYKNAENKEYLKAKVIELFTNPKMTRKYMLQVIDNWHFSCEHNLTNSSLNKIAYLGQSACCLYANIPFKITIEAWWDVPEKYRNIADSIANEVLLLYYQKQNHKQLCLKFI